MTFLLICLVVAYPVSQVSYRWHNPTMAVGYEGELQLSQFDIINTKYRQVRDKLGIVHLYILEAVKLVVETLVFTPLGEFLSWRNGPVLCSPSCLPLAETHGILPYPGQMITFGSDRSSGNANVRSIVRSDERACHSLKYFVLFTNILVKTDHSRSMYPAHSLWFSVGLDFGWTEKPQVIGSGLVRNQVISFSYPLIKSPLLPGITAVLTLSTIALDSRTGLPKVHYATALDWFIICSFLYCMASLLEFAGVHYFTKVLNKLNIFD